VLAETQDIWRSDSYLSAKVDHVQGVGSRHVLISTRVWLHPCGHTLLEELAVFRASFLTHYFFLSSLLFPWGQNGRGAKLTTHHYLVPRSRNEWSYTSTPPIRLHGVVLSLKNRKTASFLYLFFLYSPSYIFHSFPSFCPVVQCLPFCHP